MKQPALLFFMMLSLQGLSQKIDPSILNALNASAPKDTVLVSDSTAVVVQDSLAINNDPIISFESTAFDFGEITQGENIVRTFTFKNEGKDTLILTGVDTDCGCTVPTLTKKEFAPGESGEIQVLYKSKNDLGRVLQYITALHNVGKGYTFLTLSGFVNSKL